MILHKQRTINKELGFVLPTALLLLALLTMLVTTMFYVSRSSMVTSSAANASTSALYYAETGIHYMSWAMANDAEFDSMTYLGTGRYVRAAATEPSIPSNSGQIGDSLELLGYLWDPGPTGVAGSAASDSATAYNVGQVLYFDNSPMETRHLCMESAATFANCIDVRLKKKDRTEPFMFQISTKLPRYIKLDISAGDSTVTPVIPPAISPSVSALPHRSPPQIEHDQLADGSYDHNGDIPKNGAVVWLTAADPFNLNHDLELFPLDPSTLHGGVKPSDCHKVDPKYYNNLDVSNKPLCPCLQPGGQVNTGIVNTLDINTDNGIHWETTAQSGNNIEIKYIKAGKNKPLTVIHTTGPIVLSIQLATDNQGKAISTASEVIIKANGYLGALTTPVELTTLTASELKRRDSKNVLKISRVTGVVFGSASRTLVHFNNAQACNANTGEWLDTYNFVAYAIGYVNGKPSHMLRAIIK